MDYIELSCKLSPYSDDFADLLMYELGEAGFDSFETQKPVCKAYIPADNFSETALKNIAFLNNNPFGKIEYQAKQIESQNWNAVWESSYEPVKVENKCIVLAPFHPNEEGYEYTILIEPKMSFGTGHHETTWLMLNNMYEMDFDGKSVADCGCGTGVLAVFAAMKKAKSVFAFDIDDWASENTIENAEKNHISCITAQKGGMETLKEQTYDVLLANINKNILIMEMPKLANALKTGGQILMSGFYDCDIEAIDSAAQQYGLSFQWKKHKNKWSVCAFTKNNA